jgi:hypothetical protein
VRKEASLLPTEGFRAHAGDRRVQAGGFRVQAGSLRAWTGGRKIGLAIALFWHRMRPNFTIPQKETQTLMDTPKRNLERIQLLLGAWETKTPDKSFGGMTFVQFKAQVQPSLDAREDIERLEGELQSAQVRREQSDETSLRRVQLAVNGILADPTEGPDSDLYEACGYTRASERKSGLTRKKKTPTPTK